MTKWSFTGDHLSEGELYPRVNLWLIDGGFDIKEFPEIMVEGFALIRK